MFEFSFNLTPCQAKLNASSDARAVERRYKDLAIRQRRAARRNRAAVANQGCANSARTSVNTRFGSGDGPM
jgi:hypothetical protein